MNEEQAVLDFFAQPDNLPLGLSVAEQIDRIREQMNNRFWQELQQHLDALIVEHGLAWQVALTEDKNASDSLVGLHCTPRIEQTLYLRPMIEQQYLGGAWRIYYGLMWSTSPSPQQLGLPAVNNLKASLQNAGFKSNENFLGWQWTMFYPRRKDFVLHYAQQPGKLLGDIVATLNVLLVEHGKTIAQANEALNQPLPNSLTATLGQLRGELLD